MTLREIRDRLRTRDMRSLFGRSAGNDQQQLHASDKARILDAMEREEALPAFTALGEQQEEVFPYLSVELQRDLIDQLPRARVSAILNALSSDDRTALFYSFEDDELPQYLAFLNPENESTTNDLLEYPENSVAMLVDTGYATVRQEMTVSEAIVHLRKNLRDKEAADVFFIVDENGHLVDDMPMRRLVLCEPDSTMRELMDGFYVTLRMNDTKEDAMARFKEYDRVVLPVVDEENKMRGVVTIDDVLDAAEEQDTREMQQFGGMESLDYPYTETSLPSLIRKRAGWLIVLFFSEMLTASAMGHFAIEIERAAVLALFVPLIISSGGNSGSQAATLIIRAMSLKEVGVRDWWYIMRREVISGLVLGCLLGGIGFLRIVAWQRLGWYDYGQFWLPLAATVAFSLIGIVLWGTLSGSMIPLILKKCRLDPATSSAPFVATLVDVTGLIIYFTIAALILSGTLLK